MFIEAVEFEIEKADPKRTKLRNETPDPISTKLSTDKAPPNLLNARVESELPRCTNWTTEMLVQAPYGRCKPCTDNADPNRTHDRNDKLDPEAMKFSVLQTPITREWLRTLTDDPILLNFNMLICDPSLAKLVTDTLLPILPIVLTDIDEEMVMNCNTLKELPHLR
jgi:hypothetical protein